MMRRDNMRVAFGQHASDHNRVGDVAAVVRLSCCRMRTADLDFHLPPELIAQTPADRREQSRLLVYQRSDQSIAHRAFSDLPSLLRPGDLLVLNDTRVLPARFWLRKETGGRVEGLFLDEVAPGRWRAMLRGVGGSRPLLHFAGAPEIAVEVVAPIGGGEYEIAVATDQPAGDLLARLGQMPLPPYIKRDREHDDRDRLDRERYQTVYADRPGSVAAPTAGLHFTPELFDALDQRGVQRAMVTLDVGMGTFKPVSTDTLDEHVMHTERYTITPAAADALNAAKADRRRIIAVGTTAARVLESQPADTPFAPKRDTTNIFIRPGYAWRHVDALITNFHLPRSTLIALVAAIVGIDEQRRIYAEAIERRYRFFSYGDAMVIL